MKSTRLSIMNKIDRTLLNETLNESKEPLLFTMSGKMGAGKDTVGDLISNKLDSQGYKLMSTSFGYLIRKEVSNVVDGYDNAEDKEAYSNEVNADKEILKQLSSLLENCTAFDRTDEARLALQIWGTDVRRSQQDDYWITQMSKFITSSLKQGYSVNVTDARFPNEVKLIEDLSGKVIRLEVPEKTRIKRIEKRDNVKANLENLNHASETALDKYDFARVFDGTKSPNKLMREALKYILD